MQEFKGHGDQRYGHITYSHCGEDIMALNLLHMMGIKNPTYLDIGAHHPFNISNTALFYAHGYRGVNVEANPKLMPAFHELRPFDINVNIGVAVERGTHKFYMWDDRSGRNTFNAEWAAKLEVHTGTTELPCITLNDIVNDYCGGLYPDFLTMDIEGLDYDVLRTADFSKSSPKVICVEAWISGGEKFKEIMEPKGFQFYSRHHMDVMFVRKDMVKNIGLETIVGR